MEQVIAFEAARHGPNYGREMLFGALKAQHPAWTWPKRVVEHVLSTVNPSAATDGACEEERFCTPSACGTPPRCWTCPPHITESPSSSSLRHSPLLMSESSSSESSPKQDMHTSRHGSLIKVNLPYTAGELSGRPDRALATRRAPPSWRSCIEGARLSTSPVYLQPRSQPQIGRAVREWSSLAGTCLRPTQMGGAA